MEENTESRKTKQSKEILVQVCISMNASFSKASLSPTLIILFTEQSCSCRLHVSLTEKEITRYSQHNTLQTPVQKDLPSHFTFNYHSFSRLDLTFPCASRERVSVELTQLTTPCKNTHTIFGEITFLPT